MMPIVAILRNALRYLRPARALSSSARKQRGGSPRRSSPGVARGAADVEAATVQLPAAPQPNAPAPTFQAASVALGRAVLIDKTL